MFACVCACVCDLNRQREKKRAAILKIATWDLRNKRSPLSPEVVELFPHITRKGIIVSHPTATSASKAASRRPLLCVTEYIPNLIPDFLKRLRVHI